MFEFYTVRELFEIFYSKNQLELDQIEYVELEGWVKTNRDNGQIGFIEFNDGTYFKSVQLVYSKEIANYKDVSKYLTGTSIKVTGKFKLTPSMKQPFEIDVTNIELIGACDQSYPLQKKRHSFEFLREIPHLRVRSNIFNAVFRLRSVLSMAIHEFFKTKDLFMFKHLLLLEMMRKEPVIYLELLPLIIKNLKKIFLVKKLV